MMQESKHILRLGKIEQVDLAGFRHISVKGASIGPLGNFNILVGTNNSGKSTWLNFLGKELSEWLELYRKKGTIWDL